MNPKSERPSAVTPSLSYPQPLIGLDCTVITTENVTDQLTPAETLAAIITKFNVDVVSPFCCGIEADATVLETRAALAEFRSRLGLLPWDMISPMGRA